jgi:hypothetical protein
MPSPELLAEIAQGHAVTLRQLTKLLPHKRNDKPITLSCVLRWVLDGARTASGERVRLEAVRLAGAWVSTPGALQRFIARQTPDLDHEKMPVTSRAQSARERAAARAGQRLQAQGW